MDFSPLFGMLIIWLLIGIPLSTLTKKLKMKQTLNDAKAKAATPQQQEPEPRAKK